MEMTRVNATYAIRNPKIVTNMNSIVEMHLKLEEERNVEKHVSTVRLY